MLGDPVLKIRYGSKRWEPRLSYIYGMTYEMIMPFMWAFGYILNKLRMCLIVKVDAGFVFLHLKSAQIQSS